MAFVQCRKVLQCEKSENLTFSKNPYIGNHLRLDGYYYASRLTNHLDPLILYRNGIVTGFNVYVVDHNEINDFETKLSNGEYYNYLLSQKYNWGLYKIDSNIIECETFQTDGGLSRCWYPITYFGTILNDTTLSFNRVYTSEGEFLFYAKDTFHFKQFTPKPDSTNPFIP